MVFVQMYGKSIVENNRWICVKKFAGIGNAIDNVILKNYRPVYVIF